MEKKDKRGGKRTGSGRPRGDSKLYSFRMPGHLAKIIDAQEDKTAFMRQSIENYVNDSSVTKIPDFKTIGTAVSAEHVGTVHLPSFDIKIAAGFPIPLDNDESSRDIDMLRLLCPHPESSYLIRVKGESMIDAGIHSGDIVIVDKSRRNPSPREVAVCELNGEYTLKHFVEEDGQGWLVPDNPEFPRIQVNPSDDFSIWGIVTYIIHKA